MTAFSDIFTFSRASSKWVQAANGDLVEVAADEQAFDYSTGKRALLPEGQGTNYVTRSSHTAAYPWRDGYVHAGITATIVATGFVGDVPYVDYLLTGTATAVGAEPFINSITYSATTDMSAGDPFTASAYCRVISGTVPAGMTFGTGVFEMLDGDFVRGTAGYIEPSTTAQRVVYSAVIDGTDANGVRSAVRISGLTPDVTEFTDLVIRVYGWQLEKSPVATSLIQTLEDATATRAADICYGDNLEGLEDGYTLIIEGILHGAIGVYDAIVALNSGNTNYRQAISYNLAGDELQMSALEDGVGKYVSLGVGAGVPFKIAYRIALNDLQVAANGVALTPITSDVLYFVPSTLILAASLQGGSSKPSSLSLYSVEIIDTLFTEAELIEVTS